jgi:hypothetical protein
MRKKGLLDEERKLKFTMSKEEVKGRRKLTKTTMPSKHLRLPLPYLI